MNRHHLPAGSTGRWYYPGSPSCNGWLGTRPLARPNVSEPSRLWRQEAKRSAGSSAPVVQAGVERTATRPGSRSWPRRSASRSCSGMPKPTSRPPPCTYGPGPDAADPRAMVEVRPRASQEWPELLACGSPTRHGIYGARSGDRSTESVAASSRAARRRDPTAAALGRTARRWLGLAPPTPPSSRPAD